MRMVFYDEVLRQLGIWVDNLNDVGVEVFRDKTGSLQAMLTGSHNYAIKKKLLSK